LNGVCDYGRRKPNAVLGYLGGVEAYADVYRRVNDIVGVPEGIARAGLLPEALARHA
jgi:hypothetical protein